MTKGGAGLAARLLEASAGADGVQLRATRWVCSSQAVQVWLAGSSVAS